MTNIVQNVADEHSDESRDAYACVPGVLRRYSTHPTGGFPPGGLMYPRYEAREDTHLPEYRIYGSQGAWP
jgi:hypothetical protein